MRKRVLTRGTCIMLPQEKYITINNICDKLEITVSKYVREAIDLKLEKDLPEQQNEPDLL